MKKNAKFSSEEIELTGSIIMDTRNILHNERLKQFPSSRLSTYLLDGDMSNLGRHDFIDKLNLLLYEIGESKSNFLQITLKRLLHHRWHTKGAQHLRSAGTIANIRLLQDQQF